MIFAALVLVTGAALLRGPSARLFGSAGGVERVATGTGQRRSIGLDDGSRIDLSVATTVAYPRELARDRRVVTLTGEAMFSVAPDTVRPFIVNAGHLRVETTGATFVVRSYSGQPAGRVVVAEGSVRVRPTAGSDTVARQVEARQLARVTREGVLTRQASVDVDRLTAWRNGRIVFVATPLREALVELGRWQDVELRIADSVVANRRVTAEFTTLQTFTEILDEIALAIGAVYRWQGRVVTFRRER
jgi:transmembrane sensor